MIPILQDIQRSVAQAMQLLRCTEPSGGSDQMDKALSEEEKQLEGSLNQIREMLLHCESGLLQCRSVNGLQLLATLENDCRLPKADTGEKELAVRAAAASIYSTCNFLQSMENLPCF